MMRFISLDENYSPTKKRFTLTVEYNKKVETFHFGSHENCTFLDPHVTTEKRDWFRKTKLDESTLNSRMLLHHLCWGNTRDIFENYRLLEAKVNRYVSSLEEP